MGPAQSVVKFVPPGVLQETGAAGARRAWRPWMRAFAFPRTCTPCRMGGVGSSARAGSAARAEAAARNARARACGFVARAILLAPWSVRGRVSSLGRVSRREFTCRWRSGFPQWVGGGRSRASNVNLMRLQNTLTHHKEDLPEPPGPIRMYFCGPTVYARAHIGNARPFVLGMWLRSWLRATGYEVKLVHNITDINDKIYEAAPGDSAALAERATQWYLEDTGDLGLGQPDAVPRATEMVPEIVAAIEELIRRGAAYEVGGDVYFRVASDPEYGKLSGQRPDEVEEQEANPLKEDPRDFALWKANKPGEDTMWDSPWGPGR